MAKIKATLECWSCKGTKIRSGPDFPDQPCPYCNGMGYTDALLTLDLFVITDKLPPATKTIYTYQILEATDSDEYTALNANKKAWYNLFISAGILDMGDGSKAWDLFLSWIFPEGKVSHTAILAVLG
jgi:hypothetical protein